MGAGLGQQQWDLCKTFFGIGSESNIEVNVLLGERGKSQIATTFDTWRRDFAGTCLNS